MASPYRLEPSLVLEFALRRKGLNKRLQITAAQCINHRRDSWKDLPLDRLRAAPNLPRLRDAAVLPRLGWRPRARKSCTRSSIQFLGL